MKIPKPVLSVVIIVFCVAAVLLVRKILYKNPDPVKSAPTVLPSRAKGDVAAKIRVVEFTDFQCPACAKGAEAITEVFEKFPGHIYLEAKYFPLPMHPFARRAAIYAECAAGQGKFWPFHDVLYKSQSSWSKMTTVDSYFSQLAVSLKLDGVRLAACVDGGMMEGRINSDVEGGKKLGVQSTPTFFINGKMVVGAKDFKHEIERLVVGYGK